MPARSPHAGPAELHIANPEDARIGSLASDPRPPDSTKLSGATGVYRVRQGRYRIVYSVDDSERSVTIVKVGHRTDIYR